MDLSTFFFLFLKEIAFFKNLSTTPLASLTWKYETISSMKKVSFSLNHYSKIATLLGKNYYLIRQRIIVVFYVLLTSVANYKRHTYNRSASYASSSSS